MKRLAVGIALVLFAGAASAAPGTCDAAQATDYVPAGVCKMPADVQALVVREETCVHFAGEEPYDEARRREIESAIRKFCGNEKRLSVLMQRYRKDKVVSSWLRDYARDAGLTPRP